MRESKQFRYIPDPGCAPAHCRTTHLCEYRIKCTHIVHESGCMRVVFSQDLPDDVVERRAQVAKELEEREAALLAYFAAQTQTREKLAAEVQVRTAFLGEWSQC
jgi:hypothetical protein